MSNVRVVFEEVEPIQIKRSMMSLVRQNWEEVDGNSVNLDMNVDWEKYEQLYAQGHLVVIGAFVLSGEDKKTPIGYSVDILGDNPHTKGNVFSVCDLLYIHPEFRGLGVGKVLTEMGDRLLKGYGVAVRNIHSKLTHPIDNMLTELEYSHIENVYTKSLEG